MNTTDASATEDLTWFKSSYSGAEGGECLEVAWRKSSYSSGEGGECVEVGAAPTHVHIRDSKRLTGPMLTVGPDAWAGFVGLVAN
ncbi:DUF397 domain-containing protein [Streptomyces sp. NP-1717]|uniref:DUF397 domain-containing protein n=1 Tax=Streptomyces sp. NP-1717 TaxID=2704470 RepID=UPI001F5CBBB1|nr:DUF397 domain-containing protein [Streptomyces sp. NP-1717]MCI3224390.1 DUF397 domain-containing protein [Streptomyces sp. NP-1717]